VVVQARYRADKAYATGEPLAQSGHVWDVRDGKVFRFRQYTHTRQMSDVGIGCIGTYYLWHSGTVEVTNLVISPSDGAASPPSQPRSR
jgi:hypothetical protein